MSEVFVKLLDERLAPVSFLNNSTNDVLGGINPPTFSVLKLPIKNKIEASVLKLTTSGKLIRAEPDDEPLFVKVTLNLQK